ncbi:TPA: hypothetical protein ACSP2S_001689 [Aeromonas veronii]
MNIVEVKSAATYQSARNADGSLAATVIFYKPLGPSPIPYPNTAGPHQADLLVASVAVCCSNMACDGLPRYGHCSCMSQHRQLLAPKYNQTNRKIN